MEDRFRNSLNVGDKVKIFCCVDDDKWMLGKIVETPDSQYCDYGVEFVDDKDQGIHRIDAHPLELI